MLNAKRFKSKGTRRMQTMLERGYCPEPAPRIAPFLHSPSNMQRDMQSRMPTQCQVCWSSRGRTGKGGDHRGRNSSCDAGVKIDDDVDGGNENLCGDEDYDWKKRGHVSKPCTPLVQTNTGVPIEAPRTDISPIHSRYSPCVCVN